jgi:hypothetical protein
MNELTPEELFNQLAGIIKPVTDKKPVKKKKNGRTFRY